VPKGDGDFEDDERVEKGYVILADAVVLPAFASARWLGGSVYTIKAVSSGPYPYILNEEEAPSEW
jgi:hypothetical protein